METILCPTDFSPCSENAIQYANELAQCINSRIVLFHNIYEPVRTKVISYGDEPNALLIRNPEFGQEQQGKLEVIRRNLENTNWGMTVQYETQIKYGMIKNTIPQVAQEIQADMIVLGNEGAEGLQEIFIGSVAADVIKNTDSPVLIIPQHTRFKPLNKIVFATDLRGEPFVVVSFVTKIAAHFEAQILFLHILTEESTDARQLVQADLDQLRKRLPYKNATFYSETNAHIEEGISLFCRRHKADMLVVGYHPKTFWHQLFTKDFTQEMAYHTYLPMLVIHYRN